MTATPLSTLSKPAQFAVMPSAAARALPRGRRQAGHGSCAILPTLLLVLVLFLSGCGPSFYISESESTAYTAEFRTASQTNDVLARFQNQPLLLHFDNTTPVPHLASTNLADLLRANVLPFPDSMHQISLDRLSAQIQQQADPWLTQAFASLLQKANAGPSASLNGLSILVRLVSAPVVSYVPAQQTIRFSNFSVQISMQGTLHVDRDHNFLLPVAISNLTLQGSLVLSNAFTNAASVRLHLDPPQVGNVTVGHDNDGVDENLKNGLKAALEQVLVPLDKSRPMAFESFAFSSLSLRAAQPEPQLVSSYLPRPLSTGPNLDAVARGSDNHLYHARRLSGSWQDLAAISLPLPIGSDPALVSTGADRLELAAVSTTGELLYSAWREGGWSNAFRSATPQSGAQPSGYALAKPALVATAPGQIEIVALGRDGMLWHLRRKNGTWVAPVPVTLKAYVAPPVPPLRDPVMVHAGNKLALFFVDSRNEMYRSAFDLESGNWSWTLLTSSNVHFAPAAASCDSGRVELVYIGDGGHPFHQTHGIFRGRITPNLQGAVDLLNQTPLPGNVTAAPLLACSGFQQLELIGQGTDGVVYQNRFVGGSTPQGLHQGRQVTPGWQNWVPLDNYFFGTSPSSEGRATLAASLAATWSGEVVLASLSNQGSHLLWNTYDSRRFGQVSWTAVNWRGFEEVGTRSFVGSPALAVSDRAMLVGYGTHADNDQFGFQSYTVEGLPISGTLAPASGAFAITPVRTSVPPSPLFSGPGKMDVFFANPGGALLQFTALNNYSFNTNSPPPLTGADLAGVATASVGPGMMDVVAVSRDRSIHHWRYLGGNWLLQSPVTIPGSVDSAPILVSTGSGQLELFAIGGDHKLYRWRFVNGAWTGWRQVPSSFRINPTLFSPQSASSWGDGTVDLVVVAEDGAMYHTRTVSSPLPGISGVTLASADVPDPVFTLIGGKTIDVPCVTDLTRNRLSLLAIGTDGYLYQNLAQPRSGLHLFRPSDLLLGLNLQWPGFKPLTAAPARLGGAARLGDNSMAVLARDGQGHLYWNRLNGSYWTGFSGLPVLAQSPSVRPVLVEP
jgi:hypothetical protein